MLHPLAARPPLVFCSPPQCGSCYAASSPATLVHVFMTWHAPPILQSFSPTMGFLHDGHLSLVSAAAAATGPVAVVVSIYVNPSQFAPTEDLDTYPSNLAGDIRKLAATGAVAAVFCPPDLYVRAGGAVPCPEEAGGHETWIRVERLEKGLCGSSRPVFFRGVATVVAKLFNIVEPDIAVFGKKDYQQWRVICRMALSIRRSLVNAKTAALNGNTRSQQIKDQIVQTLTEAGGQVDC